MVDVPALGDAVILVIDQGTTGTKALVFDAAGRLNARAMVPLHASRPNPGWQEYDPEDLWRDVLTAWRQVLEKAGVDRVTAIAVTARRGTVVVWDRATGKPLAPALGWQDRRSVAPCRHAREQQADTLVRMRTGQICDPLLPAAKLGTLLAEDPDLARRAAKGAVAAGTLDSFLVWKLTAGGAHVVGADSAASTGVWNIHNQRWDGDLLDLFGIPEVILPQVVDNAGPYGSIDAAIYGRPIPVAAMAGEMGAGLIGRGSLTRGSALVHLGGGASLAVNTGETARGARGGLLTSVAWRRGGRTTYALEGPVLHAGTILDWLGEEVGLVEGLRQAETLAAARSGSHGVSLVPAFNGLAAPHWMPEARSAVIGLGMEDVGPTLARAALEAVAFQINDVIEAFDAERMTLPSRLPLSGALAGSDWLTGFLAGVADRTLLRPDHPDAAAAGVAALAAVATGLRDDLAGVAEGLAGGTPMTPQGDEVERMARIRALAAWRLAVKAVKESAAPAPKIG